MPNKNGKSLANRLAALANRQHKEREWQKNRRSYSAILKAVGIKTQNDYNEWIKTPEGQNYLNPKPASLPTFQNMTRKHSNTNKNNGQKETKKNCGPKPAQFIGTKKNPAYANWKECSAAAGGKRKTRRH